MRSIDNPAAEQRRSTADIVEWASGVRLADIPESVQRHALRSFVNIVGCTIGGATHPVIDLLERALLPFAGPATATVIGRKSRTDILLATQLNCVSSGVHTFDDTHTEAVVHPSGPVASALLALAEARSSRGSDVLLSFVVGVEILCRLGKAIAVPPAKGNLSWLQTAITAPVAVALAAGKLMGLDRQQLTWAVGIAAAQASGLRHASGSAWSRVSPGDAAQLGLKAALLAGHGISGGERAIEGPHGFASMFSQHAHLPALDEDLGQRFELLKNTFKPYPCGIVIHPVIDACLQLHHGGTVDPARIARIELRVNPLALTLTDRRHPKDAIEAQVSLQHWAATVLVDGAAGIAQGAQGRVDDPVVRTLRERTQAIGDASTRPTSTTVVVTLDDGSTHRADVADCVGSERRPMSDEDIDAKFRALAKATLRDGDAETLLASCWNLERLEDAGDIARNARARA